MTENNQLRAVATAPSTTRSAENPANPAIEITGLSKRFGAQIAIDDLTLTIPRGQVVALLGPNGAGKSTTAESILGLSLPDGGTVRVCGESPTRAAQRGLVGAMLQNGAMLDEISVRRMLSVVAGVCAHPLPMADVVDRAGIAPLLKKNTSRLSGGEAQRVRFAMALLPDPDVVLMDEPTVGMDVQARRRFWQQMRQVAAEGRTILFATHYLDEADREAQRVVVMSRGRIVADGTGDQIKRTVGERTVAYTTDRGRVEERTADSDAVLARLFAPGGPVQRGAAVDIEVTAPRLEDAFVQLTQETAGTSNDTTTEARS